MIVLYSYPRTYVDSVTCLRQQCNAALANRAHAKTDQRHPAFCGPIGGHVTYFHADEVSTSGGYTRGRIRRAFLDVPRDGKRVVFEIAAGDVGLRAQGLRKHHVIFCH